MSQTGSPPRQEDVDHAVQHPIEAAASSSSGDDSAVSDLDSLYEDGSETGSLTDTLASYVTRYKYLHGRRYDSKAQYIVSNDETQQDQLDLIHEIYFRLLGEKLYIAPIAEKPQRVLDLGTGTGIWAVDFADAHPSAAVIGTDVSAIQPSWVPPNCTFQIDDFNENWTFTKNSFDYIHARAVHGSVRDWSAFVAKAFEALKPGGYLELVGEESRCFCDDNTVPESTPLKEWMLNCKAGANKFGVELVPYYTLKEPFERAGYDMRTYRHEMFPCPIGTWAKKPEEKHLGGMMLVNLLQGIEGWSLYIYTQILGKSPEEFQKIMDELRKDLKNRKQHKYLKIHAVYIQKPEEAPPTSEHVVQ